MSGNRKPADDDVLIGRLAMRAEGNNWNAYYAMPGTMAGALFLGSINLPRVEANPVHRACFIGLMREMVGDIIEEKTGIRPKWGGEEAAPEHEKAGNA